MGKMTTFVIMFIGITLLFHLFGIITFSESHTLLGLAFRPDNLAGSDLYSKTLLGLQGLGIIVTIIVGFVSKNFQLAIKGPIAVILLGVLMDFTQVYIKVKAENEPIAILLFGPLMILLLMTTADWLFGTD